MNITLDVHWAVGFAVALVLVLFIVVPYIKHVMAKKKTGEQYRENGVNGVLKSLEDEKSRSREQAAQILGEKKEKKAINSLAKIIAVEEDADLLMKAAQALVNMEDVRAVDVLTEEVEYSDSGNKWWACHVLEKLAEKGIKKDSSVGFLIEAMKETCRLTGAGFPCDSAYEALKKLTGKDFGRDSSKWINYYTKLGGRS